MVNNTAIFPLFPCDSIWRADISQLPLLANSAAIVTFIGTTTPLSYNFGATAYPHPFGFPSTVTDGSPPNVAIVYTEYASESDPGPFPIPFDAHIEGGPSGTGDRHVSVVDLSRNRLYELYHAYPQSDGSWQAGSGATWDLTRNALRPDGWTSADSAGLPMAPLMVRYNEATSGVIGHALRLVMSIGAARHVWPARHHDGTSIDPNAPAQGMRLRLKASVDLSGFSATNQTILQALKTYGAFIADLGPTPLELSGVPDARWNWNDTEKLRGLHASDFEAVDMSSLMVNANSAQAVSL